MTLTAIPKVGIQKYLGVQVDYDRDKALADFGVATLSDRYLWGDEESAQEAFARASVFSAT